MTQAGLIYGCELHHLDHLAPLCALFEIPLILTDREMDRLAKKFYPDLKVIYWDSLEAPERLVHTFDTIIVSTPRPLFDEVFFFAQTFNQKRVKTIWCPHGNSDKGRHTTFMEALKDEELILTYGPRIEAFLKEKGVDAPTLRVGNYRCYYAEKHKEFYKTLLPSKMETTLLYAPTWQDQEKNSSFPEIWHLLKKVPTHYTLMIKLHPNLYQQYPNEIAQLKLTLPRNAFILEDFPPIYPLLSFVDLYIGDGSSIGYDFLSFGKPMILLKETALSQAARQILPEDYSKLFEICDELLRSPWPTSRLYEEAFVPCKADLHLRKIGIH